MNRIFYLNKLKAADRLVLPKSSIGLVQHHAIYVGKDNKGNRWYVENALGKGVQMVTESILFRDGYEMTRIEHFVGNQYQRKVAVSLAMQSLGRKYDLLNFNCEHFANSVQHRKSYSNQVGNGIVLGLLALVLGVGLSNK